MLWNTAARASGPAHRSTRVMPEAGGLLLRVVIVRLRWRRGKMFVLARGHAALTDTDVEKGQ